MTKLINLLLWYFMIPAVLSGKQHLTQQYIAGKDLAVSRIEAYILDYKQINEITSQKEASKTPKTELPSVSITGDALIFVGDSRTVGMRMSVGEEDNIWICKESKGYTWFTTPVDGKSPSDELKAYMSLYPEVTVVFNLGVNDLGNASYYISYINDLKASYPMANIVYMSVNPVDDEMIDANHYYVHNADIDAFNRKVSVGLKDVVWLDTNTYLKDGGFETWDGLHYQPTTYQTLYSLIVK